MTEIAQHTERSPAAPSGLNRLSPQAVFVIVTAFFGLAMAFITPPVQIPDEPHHWDRIYQLSQGKMISPHSGGEIPTSIVAYQANSFGAIPGNPEAKTSSQEILDNLKLPLKPHSTRFIDFSDCAIYTALPYLPQTLAMLAARKLEWPALGLLYAGRVGTLLGYLLIGWAAIRITPILKWSACMILASPVALFLAGSLSEDPVTTTTVFLATGLALRFILLPGKPKPAAIVALAVVMVIVALCKSAYLPVSLLVLAVPRDKWGPGYRRWLYPLGMIALTVLAMASWSLIIKAGDMTVHGYPGPKEQWPWILHNKLKFVGVLQETVLQYTSDIFSTAVGNLGWLDTPLNTGVIYLMYIAFIWITLNYDQPLKLPLLPRVLAAIAVGGSIGMVVLACYLYANGTGSPTVTGLQGRYFLPLGMMMCMLVRRTGRYPVQPKWMLVFLSATSLYSVWVLIERYYLPPGYLAKLLSGSAA